MRGHIRKRGHKWAIVVELDRDPTTGKRRQRWHSGYANKKAAEAALPRLLAMLGDGSYIEPNGETVADHLSEWKNGIRGTVRVSTWTNYCMNVDVHLIPRLGAIKLQQLMPAHLRSMYADLQADGGRRDGRPGGLSPRTVQLVHVILHKALRDAVRDGKLSRNAADLVTTPRVERRQVRAWTADELRTFLELVEGERLYPALLLAGMTGMRRGEVLGLRWRDLRLDENRLSVSQALSAPGREIRASEPKTRRARRSIALDPATVDALHEQHARQAAERGLLGAKYHDRDLVFAEPDGAPIHPDALSNLFAARVKASALPVIRLHDLRSTHATLALQAGVHPKVVSERLGHASVAFTLDVYSHAIPALQESAAILVANLVLQPS